MLIRTRFPAFLFLVHTAALCGWSGALAAEPQQLAVGELRGVADASADASAEQRKQAREAELEAIRRSMEVSERRQGSLREEIAALENDREKLRADLMATAQRERQLDEEVGALEVRLTQLQADEAGARQSLRQRRAVMAEVLMALQRMGRTPPPAILSRPEDALAAIRGSILAGAVLPDIRIQAEALAADLAELTQLTGRIQGDRDSLKASYAALGEERTRIDLLFAHKETQGEQTAAALAAERQKATELAAQAQSVQELIDSLKREELAEAEAARQAAQAAPATAAAEPSEAVPEVAETSRVGPAVKFADAKGRLAYPVAGEKVVSFGDPDGYGGQAQGISLAARPGSLVLAPSDGKVVYSGPFRSYGQILILDAGDNYHIVLTGMERVNVELGQSVLAGEPVAVMGATRLASLENVDHTSAQPLLYVEFRKDGNAIDSAPWWARATDGEVNG